MALSSILTAEKQLILKVHPVIVTNTTKYLNEASVKQLDMQPTLLIIEETYKTDT
jgi:hypothetical protein